MPVLKRTFCLLLDVYKRQGIPSAPAAPAFPENTADDDFTPLLDTDDDLPF